MTYGNTQTQPVGKRLPNPFGLYDILGNVNEWCLDWYGPYPAGAQTDPVGPASGYGRVIRGGDFLQGSDNCRSAYRAYDAAGDAYRSTLGFRVVLGLPAGP